MKYPNTTEFVQLPDMVRLLGLPERFPVNGLELWIFIFALVMMACVLYCVFTSVSRMMHSPVRALRVKCWFTLVLSVGQGMVADASLARAWNGIWEEYYLMTGLSLWIGGRMAITLYDRISKSVKSRRCKC
ncbi:MAG: hypothetical protein K0U66_04265 [Gammaproteobacteria bacterium]|nr:hypothetical protein [Gammaproteobacteria bacterium]